MTKIFPIIGYITFVLIQNMNPVFDAAKNPDVLYYIVQTGVAGILFVVWRITQQSSVKTQKESSELMRIQFTEIFEQLKTVHKDGMEANKVTLDRMFSIMQEDIKYKALIAESIARFENQLANHIKEGKKS